MVVVSKTFTTAETMLNARTLREWISSSLGFDLSSFIFIISHPDLIFYIVTNKYAFTS